MPSSDALEEMEDPLDAFMKSIGAKMPTTEYTKAPIIPFNNNNNNIGSSVGGGGNAMSYLESQRQIQRSRRADGGTDTDELQVFIFIVHFVIIFSLCSLLLLFAGGRRIFAFCQ